MRPPKPSAKNLDRNEAGEYCAPDPRIQALGVGVREAYYRVLAARYGITQYPVQKQDWIWYRAAELADRHGLTPEEFVTRQLAQQALTGRFWPQAMLSGKVALQAAADQSNLEAVQLAKYVAQLTLYGRLQTIYGPRTYQDPQWPLSPLIRWVKAHQQGDRQFMEELDGAVQSEVAQYRIAGDLKEVLSGTR